MPLLDHFHPPLSQRRQWESFHGGWAEAIAQSLNRDLLPERYFAEVQVKVGSREEVGGDSDGFGTWEPPRPTAVLALDIPALDVFEIQVLNDEQGPRLVAAIELVSLANKERPALRHAFAVKCAAYLQQNVNVVIVDVVTGRSANLHYAILNLLRLSFETAGTDLYAVAYHSVALDDGMQLEMWIEPLALGEPLPTMPLWIEERTCVPVNLEQTYCSACEARRIDAS